MYLFCANVKSNPLMRQSHVESDIEHCVHLGGVGFWQEIAPKRYKTALARHAAKVGAGVWGVDLECPLTLRRSNWVVLSHHDHRMHGGRAHVTPARHTLEVRAHEQGGQKRKFCFLSTHMVSAAFSNRHRTTKVWRRKMWDIHHAKLRGLVAAAHQDGFTVIIGGDFNHGVSTMGLHPDSVVLTSHGVLGLIAVPAKGHHIRASDERAIHSVWTDHDPVAVLATLRP